MQLDKNNSFDPVLQNEKEENKTPQPTKMTKEEIKQRLSGRAGEYFMFIDD